MLWKIGAGGVHGRNSITHPMCLPSFLMLERGYAHGVRCVYGCLQRVYFVISETSLSPGLKISPRQVFAADL